eukprot:1605900-Alexandrium_andersonii.AAC.1
MSTSTGRGAAVLPAVCDTAGLDSRLPPPCRLLFHCRLIRAGDRNRAVPRSAAWLFRPSALDVQRFAERTLLACCASR